MVARIPVNCQDTVKVSQELILSFPVRIANISKFVKKIVVSLDCLYSCQKKRSVCHIAGPGGFPVGTDSDQLVYVLLSVLGERIPCSLLAITCLISPELQRLRLSDFLLL